MHRSQDIRFSRLTHGILLIVREDNHILSGVAEVLIQIGRHIPGIINAPAQLSLLSKVVDPDQQRLSLPCTVGVLKVVAGRRAMTEGYGVR